jgi:hypothetical protein
METALVIAKLIGFAYRQFDEATKAEQLRTGKSAAELLEHAFAGTLENERLGAELKDKFKALDS